MSGLNNFFRPGEIIVERLASALPDISVRRVQDYAQAQREARGEEPEILVRLLRATPTDSAGDVAALDQEYTAFYAVSGSFEDWERDGPVLTTMLRALTGYEPDDEQFVGAFRPMAAIVPQTWEEQGVVVYPVTFAVPVRV